MITNIIPTGRHTMHLTGISERYASSKKRFLNERK